MNTDIFIENSCYINLLKKCQISSTEADKLIAPYEFSLELDSDNEMALFVSYYGQSQPISDIMSNITDDILSCDVQHSMDTTFINMQGLAADAKLSADISMVFLTCLHRDYRNLMNDILSERIDDVDVNYINNMKCTAFVIAHKFFSICENEIGRYIEALSVIKITTNSSETMKLYNRIYNVMDRSNCTVPAMKILFKLTICAVYLCAKYAVKGFRIDSVKYSIADIERKYQKPGDFSISFNDYKAMQRILSGKKNMIIPDCDTNDIVSIVSFSFEEAKPENFENESLRIIISQLARVYSDIEAEIKKIPY